MNDHTIVLNAGSSSLKFSIYRPPEAGRWRLEARGQIERIDASPRFVVKDGGNRTVAEEAVGGDVHDGRSALGYFVAWLRSRGLDRAVAAVGHRVVHGGARYTAPTVVTPAVLTDLRQLIPLAPLHQPHNLAAIDAVAEHLPEVPQVACFDTSFHRTQMPVAQLVPLPGAIRAKGIERYGFHGLSYEYVASVLPEHAPDIAAGRVIVAHLGNGASMCAMKDGRSLDSTFGFTALDGLCMGTRPGAVDPGVILYLFQQLGMTAAEVERVLYTESGLLGISGISNDMRELLASTAPAAARAVDYFVYRAAQEIGTLAASLGGLDGLVFTGGIGENSDEIRRRIGAASRWVGVSLDDAANRRGAPRISAAGSRVVVCVVPTNEELMVARHTAALLGRGA